MSENEESGRIFSDSWHRVAAVRVWLRSSVQAHKQRFRGHDSFVLRDRFSTDYFRVSAPAYRFLVQLSPGHSVDEVWRAAMAHEPDQALTQEEVVQLLGQLNLSNLLQFDRLSPAHALFERYRKRRGKEIKAQLISFLAIKVPLIDPDAALDRFAPLIRGIFGPVGLIAYLVLMAFAIKALLDNAPRLLDQSAGILAPDNLLLLYLGMVIAKVVHEFGHAAACKRFGGEVHRMGVMLLIFAPLPYMDATASWGFRSRAQRLFVGASGVVSELAVAAIATLVWAYTAPGTLNALAYNIMFVASVSTLLFNLNPLLRFDGYHILVDALDIPNLFQRSREQLKYLGQRFLLGIPDLRPAAHSRAEMFWLPVYGVASLSYWLLLMVWIVVFIGNQYLDVGIALAWLLFFTAVVIPGAKFINYLFFDAKLGHRRPRVLAVVAVYVVIGAGFLLLVPLPDRVRVPGVVQADALRQVHAEHGGFLVTRFVESGERVRAGQDVMQLHDPSLQFEIKAVQGQLVQMQDQMRRTLSMAPADLAALRKQIATAEEQYRTLVAQEAALRIKAPIDGVWSAPVPPVAQGQWFVRGAPLGSVVDDGYWHFLGVLPQVASHALGGEVRQAEVRIDGEGHLNLLAYEIEIVPFEQGRLPSAALGISGGGKVAVDMSDPEGRTAAEPFFEVRARLMAGQPAPGDSEPGPRLLQGRMGTMRMTLQHSPLIVQWERSLRQFFQRSFRV